MIIDQKIIFILLVVVACSIIQSLFGIGLLVFGTPILLLGGFSFTESIGIVLPCSLAISVGQICMSKSKLDKQAWFIVMCTSPFVVVSLAILLLWGGQIKIRGLVGTMLIVSAMIREWPNLQSKLRYFLERHRALYLVITGLVHGFTNMGGSLLSLYCATVFHDKERIRNSIALSYAVMAASQMVAAYYLGGIEFTYLNVVYVGLALAVYVFVGERLFRNVHISSYKLLLTAFMGALGLVLLTT